MSDFIENDEFARLTGQPEVAEPAPTVMPKATIYTSHGIFEVEAGDNWAWHEKGVYAIGVFRGDNTEEAQDRLFFSGDIRSMRFYVDE